MNKTLTARGKQISVEDVDLAMPGEPPAKLLRATVAGVTVERTHRFGAVDGSRPAVTMADVQKDLDDARQKIAEEAAWQAEIAAIVQQVQ